MHKKKENVLIDIINFLFILSLFEPNIFVKYNVINYIYIGFAIFSFFMVLFTYIKYKIKFNNILLYLIIFRIIYILSTLVNSGDILKVGYQSMVIVSIFMYANFYYEKGQFNKFLKFLLTILFIYLTINLFTYIFLPNGIYSINTKMYFLGIRTRFTEYAISLILTAYICYKNKEIHFKTFLLFLIIGSLNIILPNISTGFIGITSFIFIFLLFKKVYLNKTNSNFKIWILMVCILTYLIVFVRIQNVFEYLIINVLGKDLTFSNRTYIWDLAITCIKNGNLLIGNGYYLDGNFVPFAMGHWQAHNTILQVVYEVGLIGFTFLILFISSSLKKISYKNSKADLVVISSVIAMLIMMISEIYIYFIASYIPFIVCYYRDYNRRCNDES